EYPADHRRGELACAVEPLTHDAVAGGDGVSEKSLSPPLPLTRRETLPILARMKLHTFVKLPAASVLVLLLHASAATAQIDTGSIVGTVTDKTGGVLPGITVTATQEETGVALTAVTNGLGQYTFPNLKVGRYAVSAELQGFKRAIKRDVTLSVQDRLEINFALEIGQLSEELVVSGKAEQLQTQSADIGAVVDERTMR